MRCGATPSTSYGLSVQTVHVNPHERCCCFRVLEEQAKHPYAHFPCSLFRSQKYKQACRNACVIGNQVQQAAGNTTNTCGVIDPSKQAQVKLCVDAWVKKTGFKKCK